MRDINEIIIHCSATAPNWMAGKGVAAKMAEIDRWHKARGWKNGFGYHYLIDRDGKVAKGRPLEQIGAHVRGRNRNSVGICLVGARGASATDNFDEHFTNRQRVALKKQVDFLQKQFGAVLISGHNEYANKGCPGFQVKPMFSGPVRDEEFIEPDAKPNPFASFLRKLASLFGGNK